MKADPRVLAILVLLLVALAAASACGGDEEPDWQTAPTIPFLVCDSSANWTRPSEEEQSERVWYGPRYYGAANWDLERLRATFYEDFVHWHGGASESLDLGLQHGLWSTTDRTPGDPQCEPGPGLSRGEFISIFLLLHQAQEVRLSGNTYRLVVEKRPAGFERIEFPNLLFPEDTTEEYPQLDYNVVIVDTEGRELARAESGGPFQGRDEAEVEPPPATPEAGEPLTELGAALFD